MLNCSEIEATETIVSGVGEDSKQTPMVLETSKNNHKRPILSNASAATITRP